MRNAGNSGRRIRRGEVAAGGRGHLERGHMPPWQIYWAWWVGKKKSVLAY